MSASARESYVEVQLHELPVRLSIVPESVTFCSELAVGSVVQAEKRPRLCLRLRLPTQRGRQAAVAPNGFPSEMVSSSSRLRNVIVSIFVRH